MKLQQTINRLRAYGFTSSLLFLLPIAVPFWKSHGLNQAQIGLIQSFFVVMLFSTQIITGKLADRFGRRRMIIIGQLINVVAFAGYAFAGNFAGFLLIEGLLGIGFSCISGADMALLRSQLEVHGRTDDEKHLVGQLNSFDAAGALISSVLGGILVTQGFAWPIWATAMGAGVATIFAFSLPQDQPRVPQATERLGAIASLRELFRDKYLRVIAMFGVCSGAGTWLFVWLMVPYLTGVGVPLGWLGVAWAGYSACYMVLSWQAGRIEKALGEYVAMAVSLLAIPVAYFALGLSMALWMFPVVVLLALARALTSPITTHLVHENTDPAHYATALSAVATLTGITYAVLGPLSGWLVDTRGLQFDLLVLGLLTSASGAWAYYLIRRHHLSVP